MYKMIETHFEFVSFVFMTKRQANQYFDWFQEQIPLRIKTLIDFYAASKDNRIEDLDLSPESLIKLWSWFSSQVELSSNKSTEFEEEINSFPKWLLYEVSQGNKFSEKTSSILIDIGMYFGTVLINNAQPLKWGVIYSPKDFVEVKQPVITGFKSDLVLNPIRIADVCTRRGLRQGHSNNSLYDTYKVWQEYI
ncbi:hypothetical protein FHS18_001156 [Paenibacillus phyllosphaerae]|uniref:Uncharacterized protein n=1 Tax=Paenibacillus phyllosphaerae TaxID=274593 RepID=A0A7W5AV66_9BACL|nr:hypothetical protein [Paenibacillus phyllosphaerae]MBB3109104.1 hypothetical protein [Paenibacillus phyllosphaerae]